MREDAALYTGKDTIAAISTAVSEAGIGIIRISGPDAFAIGSRIFRTAGGRVKDLSAVPSHTIHYGAVFDGEEQVDEVLVSVMRAPRTYTAEDTVEINCHGGIYTLRRCLNAAVHAGARLARPGEFTQRAFLNGRIDLTRAEAVMDVIRARNDMALRTSLRQLGGALFEAIRSLRASMLGELAFVEAALDDPEHYSLEGYTDTLAEKEDGWEKEIRRLLSTARGGRIVREGIRTSIVGRPNAGKSSLMNRLAGRDLSIVTSIPGTTRDIVRETLRVGEAVLLAEDTAGIRDASDPIEQIGVERAMGSAREADLILCVLDTSEPMNEWDHRVLRLTEGRTRIVLLNKSDLAPCFSAEEVRDLLGEEETPIVSISAADGTGMDRFEEILLEMFYRGSVSMNDETVITNERQQDCLEKALASLLLLRGGLEAQMPEDLLMVDLTDAVDALGCITGETVQEDLYDEIFDRFCMGK